MDLSDLFAPDRVAVVGATAREGSVGRALVENLQAGFDGDVVAVNPNYGTVLGLTCYPDVGSVPDPVDLAVVAVPPGAVVDVVREAAEAGVRAQVVVTAGFGETGSEGARRERELRSVAEEHGVALVGPNSLGVVSTPRGLNATFGPGGVLPGSVSLMSQSGAFVTAVLDWATDEGLGFEDVVSLGNEAVLSETDFLEWWGDDPETDVVVGYLEGIDDGRRFVDAAREVTRETPVVLVKSGRTEAGARAASSHTGSIAGSDRAYEAGLHQAGVLRARSVQQLFDYAEVLAGQPLPDGPGVAVVTNAGGPGVLATDAVGDSPLSLASFADETIAALEDALPAAATVYNPVDAIGDADVERFRRAIDVALGDPGVGSGVVLSAPTRLVDYAELAEVVADLRANHGKPVVAVLMGGERTRQADEILSAAGIPNYFDPARGVDSLAALWRHRQVRDREYGPPATYDDVDRDAARAVLEAATDRGVRRLGLESMGLLEAYGIPTPEGEVVDDPADAETVARDLGGPVVMKIASPDVVHKSDVGGVAVGVDPADAPSVYEELVSRALSYQSDARVLGVQVQAQVDVDRGTETIAGVNRDPQFGPLVLFGLGGVFVEVFEDTAVRVGPVSEREAREMVDEIRAAPLLRGARGREPADVGSVVETVGRLSQLAADFPAVLELDINPLVALPDGVQAVDLRLTVDPEEL